MSDGWIDTKMERQMDVHSGVAQKYQNVPGFMTNDILGCLLVINWKLS